MSNVKTIISNQNKAVINKSSNPPAQTINTCNCRDKGSCPLDRKCNMRNVIYSIKQRSQHLSQSKLTSVFATHHSNHVIETTRSFRNERYRNPTELNKYVWGLKDKKVDYHIKWRIVRHAKSYSNVTKKCNLCLWEKYYIICRPDLATLNNRNELVTSCRHAKKFLLNSVII